MAVYDNAIGKILDHYSDVIEGGNTYASGTSYNGIAGFYSNDSYVGVLTSTGLVSTVDGTTSRATFGNNQWPETLWQKDESPKWFLKCSSATNAANVGAARRVLSWTPSTNVMVFFSAFPAATKLGDMFTPMEGFKRLPNNLDIESDGPEFKEGFDRTFQLSAPMGVRSNWYGDGMHTYETQLELRLRLLKYGRSRDAEASALQNMVAISSVITRGDTRDNGTTDAKFVRALLPPEKDLEKTEEDTTRLVIRQSFRLIYAVDSTYL
jgi:hypothetical protein